MKKRFLLLAAALVLMLSGFSGVAMAQETQTAQIISVNSPIDTELRQALDQWLLNSPPSPAVYYAVTYTQPIGFDTYVSMVGLNIQNPDDFWSIPGDEEGNQQVIWMDTIRVLEDGTVTFPFAQQPTSFINKLAAPVRLPLPGAGGGAHVRFPWEPGKSVQYGIKGVHKAEYGTDDETWGAVDLVSGSNMGSGAANDKVYASAGGEITYICNQGDTVAVRVEGTSDSFLYAHLLPNANLVIGHSFQSGQMIGYLKHGSFVDGCGNALQQEQHWHLHWGFVMTGQSPRKFQAEGCMLKKEFVVTAGMWTCGNTNIRPLGTLYHYGNIGIDPNTGTTGVHLGAGSGGGPSFWDYLLPGIKSLLDYFVFNNMPEHESNLGTFINTTINSAKIVFRIAQVLIRGNLNLAPAMGVVVLAISIHVGTWGLQLFGYIYRILRG